MNKKNYFLSILLIVALVVPLTVVHAEDNGVDDLRGRWDVEWGFDEDEENPDSPLILYINDLVEIPNMPDMVFAGGCMRSPGTDTFMPLSLAAAPDPENGIFDVTIYSTVVPVGGEPFVIRLAGEVTVNGNGVMDDVAIGESTTVSATGQWNGIHHDRRRTKCPSLKNNDLFQGELYTHRDIAYNPYQENLIFDTETVIVSSAMLVEDPYGNVTRVEYYTDLFSPNVDFIGRFRFTGESELSVVPGLPYTFTLLDAFGRPIEGAVSTDTWNRCNQSAPTNFTAIPDLDNIILSWDAVPIIPGQFDPQDYQITMYPMEGQAGEYGAGSIHSAYHNMPLQPFVPPLEGYPDGWDFGNGLNELEDGPYEINVWAWNHADDTNGGWGSDCAVRDTFQIMIMHKQDDQFSFEVTGSISGNVSDADGPLADVHVDACRLDDSFCNGADTDQNGNYRILGLPEGDYRVFVWGGQGGWIDEFYNETPFHREATPVTVTAGENTSAINFTMEIFIEPSPQYLNVQPDHMWADSGGWAEGADVTLSFGTYSASQFASVDGNVWFDLTDTGIAPGVNVNVTDGVDSKDLLVVSASFDNTDDVENTAWGTAPAGAWLGIAVVDENGYENGFYWVDGIQADEFGNWFVDFDDYGQDFTAVIDAWVHVFDEDGDSTLAHRAAADEYNPTLHVVPAHPEIHGHGWNPDATVTIYVDDDDDLDNGFIYTESKLVNDEPTWCIAPCFDVSQVAELPEGILPGYVVTMTDGEATREVHTTELVWTGTDTEAETVIGTASPGSWVEVTSHGPELAIRMVQADENGIWVADFSVPGPQDFEQEILDLSAGYHGRSIQFEGGVPDDGTLAYWNTPNYSIVAHPDHEWITSEGWNVGDEVAMSIYESNDLTADPLLTMTQVAEPANWDPNIGRVWFDQWAPFDLAPGMFVIVMDGSLTETMEVELLSIDLFDEGIGRVSGTAPPERNVGVGVHQPGADFWMEVASDASGNWIADFGSGIFTGVTDVHVMIWDEDGDATQANYDFP